jgi:hypothetical protein
MADAIENKIQIDPDPVAIIGLVVSALTLVAQVIDLKIPVQSRPDPSRYANLEHLVDTLNKTIRDGQKLSRILRNATDDEGRDPMAQQFIYGKTRALLPTPEYLQLQQLVNHIGLNAGTTGTWVLHIIMHDPEVAKALGDAVKGGTNDVPQKIREMYSGDMTNQEVLDEVITLLRQFMAAAENLTDKKN